MTTTDAVQLDGMPDPTDDHALAEAMAEWMDVRDHLGEDELPPDPEAPHGRRADGTPYKVSPRSRVNRARAVRTRGGRPSAPKPGKTKSAGSPKRGGYNEDAVAARLAETATFVSGGLALAGDLLGQPALVADGVAIGAAGPAISRELAALGADNPALARWLVLLTQAGPYAGLATAVLPLVFQLAANHGLAPAGLFGTRPPGDLVAEHRVAQEEAVRMMQLIAEGGPDAAEG